MSDYSEHLISMAGGDGDELGSIQARYNVAVAYPGLATLEESALDIPALLALVRAQSATIARVLDLANTRGRCGWQISTDELRAALRGQA